MPLNLGHHAAFAVPLSGMVAEAGMESADMGGRAVDGALEPGRWEAALSSLTEVLGGVAYAHFLWKKKTLQAPVFYSFGFSEQVRRDYLAYYSTIEPGAEYLLANPSHDCFTDTYWIDERAMDRNEYHAWLERETQIRHRLAAFVANNEDYLGITSLQLPCKHGPPTCTLIEVICRLSALAHESPAGKILHVPRPGA